MWISFGLMCWGDQLKISSWTSVVGLLDYYCWTGSTEQKTSGSGSMSEHKHTHSSNNRRHHYKLCSSIKALISTSLCHTVQTLLETSSDTTDRASVSPTLQLHLKIYKMSNLEPTELKHLHQLYSATLQIKYFAVFQVLTEKTQNQELYNIDSVHYWVEIS